MPCIGLKYIVGVSFRRGLRSSASSKSSSGVGPRRRGSLHRPREGQPHTLHRPRERQQHACERLMQSCASILMNWRSSQRSMRLAGTTHLVARVTLRMMNLPVPNDLCTADDCTAQEHLATCSLCSHWVCSRHRITLGAVNMDESGRPLGASTSFVQMSQSVISCGHGSSVHWAKVCPSQTIN